MTSINLTPDFAALYKVFANEARLQAYSFASNLNPPLRDTAEDWHEAKTDILRAVHGLLVPIAMATQCSTRLEDILALRQLTEDVMVTIRTQVERLEASEAVPDAPVNTDPQVVFLSADGYRLYLRRHENEWVDVGENQDGDVDLCFDADLDGWPLINGERMEGRVIEGEL